MSAADLKVLWVAMGHFRNFVFFLTPGFICALVKALDDI
jgi:hypothetical protein